MTARRAGAIVGLGVLAAACGVISPEVRSRARPLHGFAQLWRSPESFVGDTVILGGEVLEIRNEVEETHLVILHRPLGLSERPRPDAMSEGRFIARFHRYLDPAVFAPGREVTLAGTVVGTKTESVGQAPYRYVLLDGVEVHLWILLPYERIYWEPYYNVWDPWYPRYPWWYGPPWYRRP